MSNPNTSKPKDLDSPLVDSGIQEIDMDDMTGEIARTLLACEELSGPTTEGGEETREMPSWAGIASWFR